MATNEEIAQAAIVADMAHRGFQHLGGSRFHRTGLGRAPGAPNPAAGARAGVPQLDTYWVSAPGGRVQVRIDSATGGSTAAEEAALADALQAEVFDHWPHEVDRVFARWRSDALPTETAFTVAATFARQATNELSTGTGLGADASSYAAGNPRLAADLTNLEMRTHQLAGRYAMAFAENYVSPLGPAIERQRALVAVLEFALVAEAEIWTRAAVDLDQIRNQALAALQAAGPAADAGQVDWSGVLTVVGAVAGSAAVFATAGSGLAIGLLLSAIAAGTGGDLVPSPESDQASEVPLGGSTPAAVLANVDSALNSGDSLASLIESEEQAIATMLTRVHDEALDAAERRKYDLPRPPITSAPVAEVLDDEQSVIVDSSTIARITSLWIPSINGDLRRAGGLLDWESSAAWQRPVGIGLGERGPYEAYVDLRDRVVRILMNTVRELDDAGTSLADAARIIGMADEDISRRYVRIAHKITANNRNHA